MRHQLFKRVAIALILAVWLWSAAGITLAQTATFTNPLGDTTFEGIIKTIISFMLGLVGVLALGSLIWGGVLYIISLGNDAHVKQAKTIIFWAIVGLIVVTLAFVIISTVSGFLGIAL